MDQERLLRHWPDWDAEMLPHPDLAYTRAVCLQPGGPEVQVCNLHPLWERKAVSIWMDLLLLRQQRGQVLPCWVRVPGIDGCVSAMGSTPTWFRSMPMGPIRQERGPV